MPIIRFPCPQCQRVLKVGDKFAGRQAKCPGCQTPVTVPVESDPNLPEAPTAVASGSASAVEAPRRPAPVSPRRPPPPDDDHFSFGNDEAVASPPSQRGPAPAPPQEDESFEFDGAGEAAVSTALAGPVPGPWKTVRSGARLIQIGVYIQLAVLVLGMLLFLLTIVTGAALVGYMAEQMGSRPAGSSYRDSSANVGAALIVLMMGLFAVLTLALLTAEVLQLIGAIMFLQVPERTGAKGLAIGAVICQSVVIAGPFLGCLGGMADSSVGNMTNLLQGVASLTWFIMLLLFLHKIGSYLQSEALCKEVVHFAIWCGVSFGIIVGSVCLWFALAVGMAAAAFSAQDTRGRGDFMAGAGMGMMVFTCVLGLVFLGVVIAWLLKYAQLMGTSQSVITRRAGKVAVAD